MKYFLVIAIFLSFFIEKNYSQTQDDLNFGLILSAEQNEKDSLIKFIEKGANVNSMTKNGVTSLMYACQNKNKEIVSILIKNGADVNISPKDGVSALIRSCMNNDLEIVKLLIFALAEVNVSDSISKKTPLHYALDWKNKEIINYLLENEADIYYSKNDEILNPIEYSDKYEDKELYNLLLNYQCKKPMENFEEENFEEEENLEKINVAEFFEYKKHSLGLSAHFSSDFIWGGNFGIHDIINNYSLFFGFDGRMFAKRIMIEKSKNIFYQYWERRFLLYANANKTFKINENIGFLIGMRVSSTWGSYRGSDENPETKFIISPQLGFSNVSNENLLMRIFYEYMDFAVEEFSPHRFNISFSYMF